MAGDTQIEKAPIIEGVEFPDGAADPALTCEPLLKSHIHLPLFSARFVGFCVPNE